MDCFMCSRENSQRPVEMKPLIKCKSDNCTNVVLEGKSYCKECSNELNICETCGKGGITWI